MEVNESYLMKVPIDVGLEIFRRLSISQVTQLLKANKGLREKYYQYLKADIEREQQKRYRIEKIIEAIGGKEHCEPKKYREYKNRILYDRIGKLPKEDLIDIVVELLESGLDTVEHERIKVKSTEEELVDISNNVNDLAAYRCLYKTSDENINNIYNRLREEWK